MITTFLSNVKSNIFPKWQKIRDNMSVIPDPYLFLELADHLVADLVHVPDYAGHAPNPEETLEFTFIPRPAKSPELRITWKILGADLVK